MKKKFVLIPDQQIAVEVNKKTGVAKKNLPGKVFTQKKELGGGRVITIVGILTRKKKPLMDISGIMPKGVGIPWSIKAYETVKVLRWGISIKCAEDGMDETVGQEIAYRRAYDSQSTIESTSPAMLTKDMVNTLLKGELEYVSENIEKFINRF